MTILSFFFWGGGGGGGWEERATVSEFFYSGNPNLQKKSKSIYTQGEIVPKSFSKEHSKVQYKISKTVTLTCRSCPEVEMMLHKILDHHLSSYKL